MFKRVVLIGVFLAAQCMVFAAPAAAADPVTLKVRDENGNGVAGGVATPACGGTWQATLPGATDASGNLVAMLPDCTTKVSMVVNQGTVEQTIAQMAASDYTWTMEILRIWLKDHTGAPITDEAGLLQEGGGTWIPMGNFNASGYKDVPLFSRAGAYTFKTTYNHTSQTKYPVVSASPATIQESDFQTGKVIGCGQAQVGGIVFSGTEFMPGTYGFRYPSVSGTVTAGEVTTLPGCTTNAPPTVGAGGPYSVDEGGSVTLSAAGSDPDGDALIYAWDLDDNGSFETPGQSLSFSAAAIDGPTARTVNAKATDPGGLSATATATVNILNVAPTASFGNNGPVNEGSDITLSLTSPIDPSSADTAGGFTYAFDCGSGYGAFGAAATGTCSTNDNGSRTVKGKIQDKDGGVTESTAAVTIANVAPTLTSVTGPVVPVAVNASMSITLAFTDPADSNDNTYPARVDWGDGAGFVSAGTLGYAGGSVGHTYAVTGVYTVCAKVTDKDGGVSNELCFEYAIVYDPSAGFVTGGGWIDSPAGAYLDDPSMTGKATFGFVSKYKKGATVPEGNTQFQFHAAGLNFQSTAYQWLVVSGAQKAQYKGIGTINGAGDYGFLVTLCDGGSSGDKFRIKIWNKSDSDAVVYDSGAGASETLDAGLTPIGGGSIMIHVPNK